MGRGMSGSWLHAYMPSENTQTLLALFVVLFSVVFHLYTQSVVSDAVPASAASSGEAPVEPLLPIVLMLPDLQEFLADTAKRIARGEHESIWLGLLNELEDRLPGGFSGWSFVAGVLLLPALRLVAVVLGWLRRLPGACFHDHSSPDQPRPRRSSQMDHMYSVDDPARVLLNLQLGETWMNFGYWGAQVSHPNTIRTPPIR